MKQIRLLPTPLSSWWQKGGWETKGRDLVGVVGRTAMEGSCHLTSCLSLEFPTVLLLFEYASTPNSLTGHLCTRPHNDISGFLRWGREMQAGTLALSPHVMLSTMLGSIREASQVLAPNINLFILWYCELNRHRDYKFPGLGYTAIAIEDMVHSFRLYYNVFCTYYSLFLSWTQKTR